MQAGLHFFFGWCGGWGSLRFSSLRRKRRDLESGDLRTARAESTHNARSESTPSGCQKLLECTAFVQLLEGRSKITYHHSLSLSLYIYIYIITCIIIYYSYIISIICSRSSPTGRASGRLPLHQAHGIMGFVKQGLVAEVTRASISRAIKLRPQCGALAAEVSRWL